MGSKSVGSLQSAENDALLAVLREARLRTGMSQEELSRRLGQSVTFIVKVERGTRRLDVVEFVRLSETLGLEPDTLLRTAVERMRGSKSE